MTLRPVSTGGAAATNVAQRMLADVRDGFSRLQKELPPTYLYDAYGSELFDEITRLPEYYPTRSERILLEREAPSLMERLKPRTLAELGAGTAEKSRILIRAMREAGTGQVYVPIDVAASTLMQTAAALRREFPGLRVQPVEADMRSEARVPAGVPRPLVFALLGSTIGNFPPPEAGQLLRRMRASLSEGDDLLLGLDLVKDRAVLEAAYNDGAGVTADFNLNVLRVLNRELGARFDLDSFAHHAFYDEDLERIEMHLESLEDQSVEIPGIGEVFFAEGETIRTEISCKYTRKSASEMLHGAGFALRDWIEDDRGWFAVALAGPV